MEIASAIYPLQKIAKIPKKMLYFSRISVKSMDITMFFREKIKNVARNLQMFAPVICLLVFLIFPQTNLLANEWDRPVVLMEDPLVPAIELREGVVSEVRYESESELAWEKVNLTEENHSTIEKNSSDLEMQFVFSETSKPESSISPATSLVEQDSRRSQVRIDGFGSKQEPQHLGVKSIANSGLFGFLGICLSRSELPSKNFSTPCENFPLKSMTQKSANDWKSSWQRVRMTSLWLSSTNSSRSQETSIQKPFTSPTRSMSDISSTWSNGTEEFPMISSQGMKMVMGKVEAVVLEKNQTNRLLERVSLSQRSQVPSLARQ